VTRESTQKLTEHPVYRWVLERNPKCREDLLSLLEAVEVVLDQLDEIFPDLNYCELFPQGAEPATMEQLKAVIGAERAMKLFQEDGRSAPKPNRLDGYERTKDLHLTGKSMKELVQEGYGKALAARAASLAKPLAYEQEAAAQLALDGDMKFEDIAAQFGVHRDTIVSWAMKLRFQRERASV
jgi:hypothetical protein